MIESKLLSNVLKREGNNFDILRLVAALAVIVGHSYAIAPQPPFKDGVLSLLHFDYSGSLAVKFFFFLSGLLVTSSIISRPDAFLFLGKRVLRIFPGLLVCLLFAVLIVGPLFTELPLSQYLSTHETWNYISKNFFLVELQWRLPGVFTKSSLGLNGSLWTLPYEVLCYIYLAVFFGLGVLKSKHLANVVFIAVIAVSFFGPQYLPSFFSQNPDAHLLAGCFALGALMANNKEAINIDLAKVILLWVLVIVLKNSLFNLLLFYIAFFYSSLFIASMSYVKNRLRVPFDASYGVYIYGFMVQQSLHALFPQMGVHANQFFSAILSLLLGTLSWYLIEKRFIIFGNKYLNNEFLAVSKKGFKMLTTTRIQRKKLLQQNNLFVFVFLTVIAFISHAFILKFVFPGYYSPLYPQHSDFYIPAAFANSNYTFTSLLSWPRPINMIFAKLIGYFGIHGSIACVIALVCMNCTLSALLVKRIFKIDFNWLLVVSFLMYCFLLFSQPHFYIFYAQDIGAQLSYFLLILGGHLFYSTFAKHIWLSNILLFCFSLLAFLSKETYGLAAIFFTLLWFIYLYKKSFLRAILPMIMVGSALVIAFVINVYIKSAFISLDASANSSYHINLNPRSVFQQLFLYASEGVNIANILMVGLITYLVIKFGQSNKKELLLITIGCIVGVIVSWLPNAILPNHHFKGYSFNGAYLFYLPLIILPLFWRQIKNIKWFALAILVMVFLSPVFNHKKYKENEWVLIQENTQRNLLSSLETLINNLQPSKTPRKILIQGITFPFHPFVFPQALRVFPHAVYANFDVVNYNPSFPSNQQNDLVKFIDPLDSAKANYEQKWIFDENGKLVKSVNLIAERIFNNQSDSAQAFEINEGNFSQFVTSGFYNFENGIRWTNGSAVINIDRSFQNKDSVLVQLDTYMPPICKDVNPQLTLIDGDNKTYNAAITSRKDNIFYYLFIMNEVTGIQKINILSETIDASPDQRVLSFPFISLKIENKD